MVWYLVVMVISGDYPIMLNYASNCAIMLPGKYPGNKDLDVLLPSNVLKYKVWSFYSDSNK